MAETYGMYTAKGNAAVAKMVAELKELAESQCEHCNRFPAEQELREALVTKMLAIEKKHGEVYDTDVRDQLYYALKPIWESLGYDPHTLESEL